jgi:signal transduction histidine kinase
MRSVKKEIEAREKIETLAGELKTANEGQSNLIHIMNHQIKGYLGKARNIFAELLTDPSYGPIGDSARPMMQVGLDSLTEGVGFVQQVLNGSSAESGTLTYVMKPIDFRQLVTEAAEHQKDSIQKKGLSLEMNIEDGTYATVGDSVQLKETLRDLIDNSINYTPSGGLKIGLKNRAGKILFSVSDTGIGISKEDMPKLFTKGGRGKDSLKINVNSTGYGLAFVKAVVEAHKGRVWVESEGSGKGSAFFIELPVA